MLAQSPLLKQLARTRGEAMLDLKHQLLGEATDTKYCHQCGWCHITKTKHHSRSVTGPQIQDQMLCMSPYLHRSPTNGERLIKYCHEERSNVWKNVPEHCGPQGRFFLDKTPVAVVLPHPKSKER